MQQWYFTKNGEQDGPATPEQIQALVKANRLDPATTHVWHEGMDDWQLLNDSGLLASLPQPAQQVLTSTPGQIYQQSVRPDYEVAAQYPGYGRLRYFLTSIVLTVVSYIVIFAIVFLTFQSSSMGAGAGVGILVLMLIMFAASMYIAYQRTINLGMSGWALLWSLVPIVSIWFYWRLIACPAGYDDHRTLDSHGKVITGLIVGFTVLFILLNIVIAISQA